MFDKYLLYSYIYEFNGVNMAAHYGFKFPFSMTMQNELGISGAELREAIQSQLNSTDDSGLIQSCGLAYDLIGHKWVSDNELKFCSHCTSNQVSIVNRVYVKDEDCPESNCGEKSKYQCDFCNGTFVDY